MRVWTQHCGLVAATTVAAHTAFAQGSEWTSVARISNGTCLDGAIARIIERPGTLQLKLAHAAGPQFAEFEVALAADGSGRAEFKGSDGSPTRLEVPAGAGKRTLKSAQINGPCQWTWTAMSADMPRPPPTGEAWRTTWRMGLELIDQWSVFTCAVSLPDRFWDLTLEGSQLSASGPEGATWTAAIEDGGAFKARFTGSWRGQPFDAEVIGNVQTKWVMQHNITAMCWYQLVPK